MTERKSVAALEVAKRSVRAAQSYARVRKALYEREKTKCKKLKESGAPQIKLYDQKAEAERQRVKALEAEAKSLQAQIEYEEIHTKYFLQN